MFPLYPHTPVGRTTRDLFSLSNSPLEEQNGNDYDDDENDRQHGTHDPQHLRVLSLSGHPTVELHHDGLGEGAGRKRLQTTRGRSQTQFTVHSNEV